MTETQAAAVAALAARVETFIEGYVRERDSCAALTTERDRRYSEGQQQRDQALVLALDNTRREALRQAAEILASRAEVQALEDRILMLEGRAASAGGERVAGLSARALLFSVLAAVGGIFGIIYGIVHLAGG